MNHVHISEGDHLHGTVWLDDNGHAKPDSPASEHLVRWLEHQGHSRENGQDMLNTLVHRLDRASLIHAAHCDQPHAS